MSDLTSTVEQHPVSPPAEQITVNQSDRNRPLLLALLIFLSLIPIANIFRIILTTGANNLSNDYAMFLPLIDKILSGSYQWNNFFRDSFFVSHFQPLPILVYLGNALLTGWNVYYELAFIAVLSIIRVVLTYQVLTRLYPLNTRYLLIPIISMLVFSTSQVSSFEFGASAVPLGLTAFGFTLAAWGLVKFRGKLTGILICIMGGWIASWTAATGIIAWVIFFLGMIILEYRKIQHYVVWLAAAVLINFPYLYFLVINRLPGTNASLHSLLDLRLIINLVGRPFANGIGQDTGFIAFAEAAGWIGLSLVFWGVALVIINRRKLLVPSCPALMFMAFGLLCAWQTSVFRVMIAPWYTNMVMPYWIGLVGLAYVFSAPLSEEVDSAKSKGRGYYIYVAYPIVTLILLLTFYFSTNLTYRDKSFYLLTRSPDSASCLRNYEWAPTYCERRVFQWTINRTYLANFAWLLQRHNLNVFSRHQVWTMQGDTVLGSVYSAEQPNRLLLTWYDGLPGKPSESSDFRHLNIQVSPTNSAVWQVDIPDNIDSADFLSAVGVGKNGQPGNPITFNVYISPQDGREQLVYTQTVTTPGNGWHPFAVDLLPYRGQRINLRLAADSNNEAGVSLFKFPIIQLDVPPQEIFGQAPAVRPINTELSPNAPITQVNDFVFNLEHAKTQDLEPVNGSPHTWQVNANPSLTVTADTPLDMTGYGWVAFSESASNDIPSHAAELLLYFEGQDQPVVLTVPLLADSGSHRYTYPLRLLNIPGKLTAVQLIPAVTRSSSGENLVSIDDIRLIHLP